MLLKEQPHSRYEILFGNIKAVDSATSGDGNWHRPQPAVSHFLHDRESETARIDNQTGPARTRAVCHSPANVIYNLRGLRAQRKPLHGANMIVSASHDRVILFRLIIKKHSFDLDKRGVIPLKSKVDS